MIQKHITDISSVGSSHKCLCSNRIFSPMWQATLIKYPIQRLNHRKYLGDSFVLVIDLVSRLAFGVGGVGFIQNMETSLDLISW